MDNKIKVFEDMNIRAAWNEELEEWFFSVVDVIGVLTDSPNPRKYWSVLKTRLKKEGNESATNCSQLKLKSHTDGKSYKTDVADTEQLLGIIQSIPSPKAETFKMWLAEATSTELSKAHDPQTFEENRGLQNGAGNMPAMHEKRSKRIPVSLLLHPRMPMN